MKDHDFGAFLKNVKIANCKNLSQKELNCYFNVAKVSLCGLPQKEQKRPEDGQGDSSIHEKIAEAQRKLEKEEKLEEVKRRVEALQR